MASQRRLPFVWFLAARSFATAVANSVRAPSVAYSDLVDRPHAVRGALSDLGILTVPGVPGYADARRSALRIATSCIAVGGSGSGKSGGGNSSSRSSSSSGSGGGGSGGSGGSGSASHTEVLERQLADGSIRRTVVAKTAKGALVPASVDGCSEFEEAADLLRALVQATVSRVLRIWSRSRGDSVLLRHESGSMISNLEEAVFKAEHLEHFHTYTTTRDASLTYEADGVAGKKTEKARRKPLALELHTDAGLLVAFTAPLNDVENDESSGLWIEKPCGDLARLDIPADSVGFMVGESSRWLPWAARPVPHALALEHERSVAVRAWYGLMLRLPDDAVLPGSFDPASATQPTFGAWWTNSTSVLAGRDPTSGVSDAGIEASTSVLLPSLGCSPGSVLSDQPHACPVGSAWCWMMCLRLPDSCSGGTPRCLDSEGHRWNGRANCSSCKLQCSENSIDDKTDMFCDNSAHVDMLMNGFVIYGFKGDPNLSCLVFFLPGLVLDTCWKFWLAAFVLFLLGVCIEVIASLLPKIIGGRFEPLLPAIYAARMSLSYSAMLAVMSFSFEFFLAVILGLAFGQAITQLAAKRKARRSGNLPVFHRSGNLSVLEETSQDDASSHTMSSMSHTPCCRPFSFDTPKTAPRFRFQTDDEQTWLQLGGLTCDACVHTVSASLRSVPGVDSVHVTFERRGHATISGTANLAVMMQAVEDVGFTARPISSSEEATFW